MSRESATLSKETTDIQVARWKGFEVLARALKNRHILGVEMFRTLKDETVAIITISRNGEPVRFMLRADEHGKVRPSDCPPRQLDHGKSPMHLMHANAVPDDGAMDPSIVSVGHPPPTEPTTPGLVAVIEGLLTDAFNVGEQVDTSK